MAGRRWGRDFVNRAFDRATEAGERDRQRVRDGGTKRKKRVLAGNFDGALDQIDWLACNCGYRRPTAGGKPVRQDLDPAYAAWTETETAQSRAAGKKSLHVAVKTLIKEVYTSIGYHHNTVALGSDPGYPDLTLWGPGGPGVMWREEKSMRGVWKEGQREHLLSLHQKGQDVKVWKPCCLLSGLIEVELADLAGMAPRGRGLQRRQGTIDKKFSWKDIADGALTEPV